MVQLYLHELERAEATAGDALDVTSDDANARAISKAVRWAVALFTDRFEEAGALAAEVDQISPFVTDDWTNVMVGATLVPIRDEWSGQYPRSIEKVEATLSKFDDDPDLLAALFGRWVSCMATASVGDHQAALDRLIEDVEFAGRCGVILMYLRGLNTVGFIYGDLNDIENALVWNERGFREAVAAGLPDPEIECNAALNIGDNMLTLGRLDEAEERYRWVEAVFRDPTPAQRFMLWRYSQHMLHSYGVLHLLRGDADKAQAYADECLEMAVRSDSQKNVIKARRLRGEILAAAGRHGDAEAEFRVAVDVGREIGNAGQLWRTYASYARSLAASGRDDAARSAYGEASRIVDRISGGLTDDTLRGVFLASTEVVAVHAGAR
jgi:tetratricopeptide (TPR) repeat protein